MPIDKEKMAEQRKKAKVIGSLNSIWRIHSQKLHSSFVSFFKDNFSKLQNTPSYSLTSELKDLVASLDTENPSPDKLLLIGSYIIAILHKEDLS